TLINSDVCCVPAQPSQQRLELLRTLLQPNANHGLHSKPTATRCVCPCVCMCAYMCMCVCFCVCVCLCGGVCACKSVGGTESFFPSIFLIRKHLHTKFQVCVCVCVCMCVGGIDTCANACIHLRVSLLAHPHLCVCVCVCVCACVCVRVIFECVSISEEIRKSLNFQHYQPTDDSTHQQHSCCNCVWMCVCVCVCLCGGGVGGGSRETIVLDVTQKGEGWGWD